MGSRFFERILKFNKFMISGIMIGNANVQIFPKKNHAFCANNQEFKKRNNKFMISESDFLTEMQECQCENPNFSKKS